MKKKVVLLYFTLSIYCNAYLMFCWSTYDVKAIGQLADIIAYTGPFLLFFNQILLRKLSKNVRWITLGIFVLILLLEIEMNWMGYSNTYAFNLYEGKFILTLIVLLLCEENEKKQIFEYALKLFAIVTLPSVIYFLFRNAGIRIPSTILNSEHKLKSIRGVYYEHYPLGLIAISPGAFPRLCGVFDEPGVVGTLSAIFIATGYDKVSKKWALILLIEGVFSCSVAFYLLFAAYVIVRAFFSGFIKFASVALAILVGVIWFFNASFQNEFLSGIQARIDLSSMYLFTDNRTSSGFDSGFDSFVQNGGYPFWFGYGRGAVASNPSMSASFSYKCLFYDYGIIGTLMYFAFFVLIAIREKISKNCIPFLVVFAMSIYQRPYVFNIQYVTIFITALCFIKVKEIEKK